MKGFKILFFLNSERSSLQDLLILLSKNKYSFYLVKHQLPALREIFLTGSRREKAVCPTMLSSESGVSVKYPPSGPQFSVEQQTMTLSWSTFSRWVLTPSPRLGLCLEKRERRYSIIRGLGWPSLFIIPPWKEGSDDIEPRYTHAVIKRSEVRKQRS